MGQTITRRGIVKYVLEKFYLRRTNEINKLEDKIVKELDEKYPE
jgi:hypothetical protein